jgi:hypothetical protein
VVEEKIDQGSEGRNSVDRFGGGWEASLHVREGDFRQSGHAGWKGKIMPFLVILVIF